MSTKDDIKNIADMHSKEKVEIKNQVDTMLSDVYKKMYQVAYKGEYEMAYKVSQKNSKIFLEVMKVLKAEKFGVFQRKVISDYQDGEFYITWGK